MQQQTFDEYGSPVAVDPAKPVQLTVRMDEETWERLLWLKNYWEGEKKRTFLLAEVSRAAIHSAQRFLAGHKPARPEAVPKRDQGDEKKPAKKNPKKNPTIVPPSPPAEAACETDGPCSCCAEYDDGEEYRCKHCGRSLKASMMIDLLHIKGDVEEIPPSTAPVAPKKKKKKP